VIWIDGRAVQRFRNTRFMRPADESLNMACTVGLRLQIEF
jgi:hypothetical protein